MSLIAVCRLNSRLFSCRQVAVKALRGAQYARDANRDYSLDDVRRLTDGFDDEQLNSWARELHQLITNQNRLIYPTEHSSMNIPHDVITQETCQIACTLSSSVVGWCQAFFNRCRQP